MPNRYPDAWPQTTRHERPSEVDRKREYDDEAILVPIPLSAEELAEREQPSDEEADAMLDLWEREQRELRGGAA